MTDEDDLLKIGRWVERERKARKLTQEQLAGLAGVSRTTVYMIETGRSSRTINAFSVIAALDGRVKISSATREF